MTRISLISISIFLLWVSHVRGEVGVFEADGVYPEDLGFDRSIDRIIDCKPERWFEPGWFVQHLDAPGDCHEGPPGDMDRYAIDVSPFERRLSFWFSFEKVADLTA